MTKAERGSTNRPIARALTLAIGAFALFALALTSAVLSPAASADLTIGGPGSAAGQFQSPSAIAVDQAVGDFYVADTANNRIDVFDEGGIFLRAFGWGVDTGAKALQVCTTATTCQAGSSGSGAGQFNGLTGVAVDNEPASPSYHDVFAYDAGSNRVQRFTPGGAFVLAFGDEVNHTTSADICTAASGNTCGAAVKGYGVGQFNEAVQLALGGGVVYLADSQAQNDANNKRVQAFDPSGSLSGQVLTLTGDHGSINAFAAGSAGDFYIGTSGSSQEAGKVRKFNPAGILTATFNSSYNIRGLAVDYATGDVFVSDDANVSGGPGVVNVYDTTGSQLSGIYGEASLRRTALAARHTASGVVYAISESELATSIVDLPLPPSGPVIIPPAEITSASAVRNTSAMLEAWVSPEGKPTTYKFEYVDQANFEVGGFANPATQSTPDTSLGSSFEAQRATFKAIGLAPETTYHFRITATNPGGTQTGPEATFATLRPFEIRGAWATEIDVGSAALHTEVNPIGIPATAYFQYVDDAVYKASGFAEARDLPNVSGAQAPLDLGSGEEPIEVQAALYSLSPATTYHYRVVVEDSFGSETGPEQTLTTFPYPPGPNLSCPNQVFRTGASARLTDCRAYEMVSPIDKDGADVAALETKFGNAYGARPTRSRIDQASPDGNGMAYGSQRSFGNAESSAWATEYLSRRDPQEGWSTRSISPPRNGFSFYYDAGQEIPFMGLSEDLCSAWLLEDSGFALTEGAPPGVPNLYRRKNCGEEGYELLTSVVPPGFGAEAEPGISTYFLHAQGFSADGSRSVFRADAKLTSKACPTKGIFQIYESIGEGVLRLVSALPNGNPVCAHSSVGTYQGLGLDFRQDNVRHAVSADGTRVYWSDSENSELSGGTRGGGPGTIYLRENADQPQSSVSGGSCTQPERACTITVSAPSSVFRAASPTGSTAIYTTGEKLYEFDLETKSSQLIAEGVVGMLGTSEDATHLYLVSGKALTGEAENEEGDKAEAGQRNVYFYAKGEGFTFVATLAGNDTLPFASGPGGRSARVTSDGLRVAFSSHASLTGYDNIDQNSGKIDDEIFVFDETTGALSCASCDSSGARPAGRLVETHPSFGEYWAAARIPGWETQQQPSRALSDDGKRLFFESFGPLVLADTNGRADVYEWEAVDSGDCREESAVFRERNGGCLSLISSGENPKDSEFLDASADGRDVFFSTNASLLPQDPGLVDIYDARAGGGLPPPPGLPPACEGEACQGPLAPPNDPTPASSAFEGAGNVVEQPAKKKAKKKRKHVKKQQSKRANHKRRAAR